GIGVRGPDFGVEFTGGRLVEYSTAAPGGGGPGRGGGPGGPPGRPSGWAGRCAGLDQPMCG
ncbi:hypothetical protein AAHZ94_18960, partial [Streptomyces sp. HSW2009]|uniref:hypothetical protein n=1 Tax=Streptomyces sp. HSW2009 TaxID=3142890 RepID=UPI0032ED4BE8